MSKRDLTGKEKLARDLGCSVSNIDTLLSYLSDKERVVLDLYYEKGHSLVEISYILGISLGYTKALKESIFNKYNNACSSSTLVGYIQAQESNKSTVSQYASSI